MSQPACPVQTLGVPHDGGDGLGPLYLVADGETAFGNAVPYACAACCAASGVGQGSMVVEEN